MKFLYNLLLHWPSIKLMVGIAPVYAPLTLSPIHHQPILPSMQHSTLLKSETAVSVQARTFANLLSVRHLLVLLCAVVTLVLTGTVTSSAQSTTFESFSLGTVHYQGPGTTVNTGPPGNYTIPSPYGSLWTIADEWGQSVGSFDQAIKDDGTGNKVWRMSNAVTTGGGSGN